MSKGTSWPSCSDVLGYNVFEYSCWITYCIVSICPVISVCPPKTATISDKTEARWPIQSKVNKKLSYLLSPVHQPWESQCTASQIEGRADRRQDYANSRSYCVAVAVKSMGPLGHEASEFLTDLGRCLSLTTDDVRETSQLFQRVSFLIHAAL